ncbi:hypothetical protein DNK48_24880 [Streptomyces malaysiensis subsp. malaysiensis]|nr:hypothetical protein DNK48_24880 [Streptomyces malaysiensis]
MRRADDRGSATVWVALAATALCAVFAVVLAAGQAMVARHRAGGAADLAALAAADHGLEGVRTACGLARRVASAQGARVVRCALSGEIADLTAEVRTGPFTLRARARAGPAGTPVSGPPSAPGGGERSLGGRRLLGGAGEQGRQQTDGGLLVERVVAVAAFGRLDTGRTSRLALADGDRLAGGRQPAGGRVEGTFGEARAPGVPVVHEDGRQQRVRVQRDGHPADVPAVTGGEERQDADRGVLGGVQGAPEGLGVHPGVVELVIGDRPPHGPGAQGARRKVQLGLAEDLTGDQLAAQKRDDLVGDLDRAETQPRVPPGDLGGGLQDGDRRGVAGRGRVGRSGLLHQGDRVVEVELLDEIAPALMEVDGALVDGGVGRRGVHGAQQPPGGRLDDLDRAAARPADVGEVGGALTACPVPRGRPAPQQLALLQLRHQLLGGGPEEFQVGLGERKLGRGRAEVRREDVRVVRVQDGGLHRLPEEGVRVVDEIGVQRVVPGDQDREGPFAGAPSPSRLLPQGGAGAGIARHDHGVQAGDVHPQLQGGGGGEPQQLTGVQGPLQGAALLGEIAAAIGGDPVRQRAVHFGEPLLGDERDELRAPPGAHEGDRTDALDGQVGEQVRGLGRGRAAYGGALLTVELGQRRLPEGEDDLAAGRAVLGDLHDGHAGQPTRGGRRIGGGGRGEQEHRRGAVAGADAAQPAQHLGHMGAEDTPVGVALVDHHITQRAQEGGPSGVAGQDAPVEHVGVGEHVVRVLPDPLALLDGRVAVVDRRPDAGAQRGGEVGQGAPLVGGQRLGGGEIQGGRPSPAGFLRAVQQGAEDGGQIGEGLAGGGSGGHDHGFPAQRVFGGARLVGPGALDSSRLNGVDHLRPDRRGPVGMGSLARGQVLRMSDARAPARPGAQPTEDGPG